MAGVQSDTIRVSETNQPILLSGTMDAQRVTCIKTEGYPASLVLNAVYDTLPDPDAAKHQLVRVIDESGEDYLYPKSYFVPVEAPAKVNDRESHAPA